MFNYRNEAAFSNALTKYLRSHHWFVQRIESGQTGRGIPDIYCISPEGHAFWFELKRMHATFRKGQWYAIPWRPGQQAWLHSANKYQQQAFTLCCFDNCIAVIPHNHIYKDGVVSHKDILEYWFSWKDAVK